MPRFLLLVIVAWSAVWTGAGAAQPIDVESDADNYADVWFRQDADRTRAQLWGGSTLTLGQLDLGYALLLEQKYSGVVDPLDARASEEDDTYRAPTLNVELGPAFSSGGFFFWPKLAIGYDFDRKTLARLTPQLITIIQGGPLYIESWLQWQLNDLFDTGAQDSFYARGLLLLALSNELALGLQTEQTVATKNDGGEALRALPLGVRANWAPLESLTFGLFVGYEFVAVARNSEDDVLAGRLTAAQLW